jgi:hypothetical protein
MVPLALANLLSLVVALLIGGWIVVGAGSAAYLYRKRQGMLRGERASNTADGV